MANAVENRNGQIAAPGTHFWTDNGQRKSGRAKGLLVHPLLCNRVPLVVGGEFARQQFPLVVARSFRLVHG